MYTQFSMTNIISRRIYTVLLGLVCLPVLLFIPINKRTWLTSYMYRCWSQTSTKPLWLSRLEHGTPRC
ncbi:DUF2517 family protein [Photobacterium iliopiscarium]|jgi:hypothetical protein|uniref:DUF2517 domain-containing protein n=1 Tax=Photobacterium iliopiscarium TaxID=56192 RepID=A0A2T3MQ78_9GAMM|nr:DUF2517 family protein [Photobacterium iliopiscarium]MCD9467113.1 hypothetical protein [Photobacterium iliopiscarium]MCD9487128.1 DUF2517 family protein [Photobacterium iliopiscarium]MCF2243700.1 DUF2517 family protein [Photobacterium iliopiscarium]PST97069.1 DUF2517 domain-containing protein [Photobacterium iliopiscarium]PSU02003.1 DUF2517 domain-containing protein [Photobacterium iliopiscarium]